MVFWYIDTKWYFGTLTQRLMVVKRTKNAYLWLKMLKNDVF